jgi:ABC-type Fe3+/spermidine/putrescine transport system ATPase subunit
VALARTLAVAPPLILLDEPFSNLDAKMRVETRQEVRRLLKDSGSAGILVTHDQEEALALADRIAVMEAGRVVQIGTPDEIYRNPATAFVASFIGRSNILRHGQRAWRRRPLRQPAAVARGQRRGQPGRAARTDPARARSERAARSSPGANSAATTRSTGCRRASAA